MPLIVIFAHFVEKRSDRKGAKNAELKVFLFSVERAENKKKRMLQIII